MSANTDLVRTAHARFCAGQLDSVLELAHPDITVDAVPFGVVFEGKEGFLAFLSTFHGAFPDIDLRHVNVVELGDQVVVEARWTGTHTGPLATPGGTLPPTNRRVEGARICEVFRVTDGRIRSITNYQDTGTWLRQLGLA